MYVCTVYVRIKVGAQIEAGCQLSVYLIEAGARIEAGSNTPGYSYYIRNGLFHFELRFLDTNVTEEYLRLKEGQLC